MKKFISLLLALLVIFTISGCSAQTNQPHASPPDINIDASPDEDNTTAASTIPRTSSSPENAPQDGNSPAAPAETNSSGSSAETSEGSDASTGAAATSANIPVSSPSPASESTSSPTQNPTPVPAPAISPTPALTQTTPPSPTPTPELTPKPTPTPEPIVVQSITINIGSTSVVKGSIIVPVVTVLPADAEDKSFTLGSSNLNVLRMTDDGWLAVGGGSAELVAVSANGVKGTVTINVTVPVEAITLNLDDIAMSRGDYSKLTVTVYPADATDWTPQYVSGDNSVLIISGDGSFQAVGAGTTTIHCTVGGVSAFCTVTVTVPVMRIIINLDRTRYTIGDRFEFSVRIYPEDATDKTYDVQLGGAAASLYDSSTISCDAGGTVTITAIATNGVTETQTVSVIDLAAYANEVLRLTNIERQNEGLGDLSQTSALTKTALTRAGETIRSFSHDRPDGRSCFTAFDENGVTYYTAGENIAMGQNTPAEVVQAWMNSPGHRENIMNPDFSYLGVGVAMDNNGSLYWSQNFTG